MRFLFCTLAACSLVGCGVPDTSYRLTNRSHVVIEVTAMRDRGAPRRLGTLEPGATKDIGQVRTLEIKSQTAYTFRLPIHVTKWVPQQMGNGRLRYDLSNRVGDSLEWTDRPPLLHASNTTQAIATSGGKIINLPSVSLAFPLEPMGKSQSVGQADQAYQEQKRKDVFTVGHRIENQINSDPIAKTVVEPIDWPNFKRAFGKR
jgi:hypothetical protein